MERINFICSVCNYTTAFANHCLHGSCPKGKENLFADPRPKKIPEPTVDNGAHLELMKEMYTCTICKNITIYRVIGCSGCPFCHGDRKCSCANLYAEAEEIAQRMADNRLARAKTGGMKYDGDKPEMALLSSAWVLEVAKVLTYGKKKYAADNWRQGIEQRRLISAALRHLLAYNNGEDLDPETGLSHLGHASCCVMFAFELLQTHPELDDRYKVKT